MGTVTTTPAGNARPAVAASTTPTAGSAPVLVIDDASRAAESLDRPWRSEAIEFVQRINETYVHWSVVEVDASTIPGARGSHCLVFTRAECVRRVWDYPVDWQSLDDTALAALSWHR